MESCIAHGQKYIYYGKFRHDRRVYPYCTTICGRHINSTAVNTDIGSLALLCKNCDRSLAVRVPTVDEVWFFDWVATGANDNLTPLVRDGVSFKRSIRGGVNLDYIRIVIVHTRWLTRIWVRPLDKKTASQPTKHQIKHVVAMTKLWIDSGFYRSTTLGDYLAYIL